MKKSWIILAGVVAVLALTSFTSVGRTYSSSHRPMIQDTPGAPPFTETPQQAVPASTPTPASTDSFDQMLKVEADVLETTRSTLSTSLTIITLIFTVVLGAFAVGGLSAYTRISDAAKRADKAVLQVDNLQTRAEALSNALSASQEANNKLSSELERMQQDLAHSKSEHDDWRLAVKRDFDDLRNTLLLVQIEEYSVDLFGDDPKAKWTATQALIAMGDPTRKAFVRRRSVRALGRYALEEPDSKIIQHLETVAKEDPSLSVRRTARDALDKISKKSKPDG